MLEVRLHGRPMGPAIPQSIRRQVHPHAVAGDQPDEPVRTGIDYLAMIDAEHAEATASTSATPTCPTRTGDDGCAGLGVRR